MGVDIYLIVVLSDVAHHLAQLLVDGAASELFEVEVNMAQQLSFVLVLVVTDLEVI